MVCLPSVHEAASSLVGKALSSPQDRSILGCVLALPSHLDLLSCLPSPNLTEKPPNHRPTQVIPAVGGEVLIVNGRCRGERATLLSLDTDAFAASVRVTSDGPDLGTVLDKVEYEDVCKAVPLDEA